jgi:hypothetical protein
MWVLWRLLHNSDSWHTANNTVTFLQNTLVQLLIHGIYSADLASWDLFLQDLRLSQWLHVIKSPWATSHVKMEQHSNVSEAFSASIMLGLARLIGSLWTIVQGIQRLSVNGFEMGSSAIPIGSGLCREDIQCIYIHSKQQSPITSFPDDGGRECLWNIRLLLHFDMDGSLRGFYCRLFLFLTMKDCLQDHRSSSLQVSKTLQMHKGRSMQQYHKLSVITASRMVEHWTEWQAESNEKMQLLT